MEAFHSVPSSSPLAIITLLNLKGVGSRTVLQLIRENKTLEECKEALLKKKGDDVRSEKLWQTAYDDAERILKTAHENNIKIIPYTDTEYPPFLRLIPDPPPIIYLKGQLIKSLRNVACVGTREPSESGKTIARRIFEFLASNGWNIISGLALGIDTIAHQVALDNHSYTIAVLGNSLDHIYPPENIQLAKKILDQGGALISEQPFRTPATRWNLIARNRLQSGLSLATFVIQTDIRGGTMATVRFTLLQKRLLYVPYPAEKNHDEEKNRGILALCEKTGRELVSLLGVSDPKYKKLLEEKYGNIPVARVIRSKNDYPEILKELEDSLKNSMKKINDPYYLPNRPTNQMSLGL